MLPQEPQSPVPSRRISTLPALVIGLVAGAAVVGLIWLLVGTSGDSAGPAGDASAACATLDRVGELKPAAGRLPNKDDGSGFSPAVADRLAAARVLADAAARDDNRYKALSEALDQAHTSIGRNFRLDEKAIGQLDEARKQCDAL